MNSNDYMAFLEKVANSGVLEEFNEELYGNEVHRDVDAMTEMTAVELRFLISGLIEAHNNAIESGDFHEAVMYHDLMMQFLDLDKDVADEYEEAQQQVNPLEQLF